VHVCAGQGNLRRRHDAVPAVQVLHMTDHNKPAWDELLWGVKTGGLTFEHAHGGKSEFEWLRANPAEEDKFSKAMKEVDSLGKRFHFALLVADLAWHESIQGLPMADVIQLCRS
jgi:hypothetical protein